MFSHCVLEVQNPLPTSQPQCLPFCTHNFGSMKPFPQRLHTFAHALLRIMSSLITVRQSPVQESLPLMKSLIVYLPRLVTTFFMSLLKLVLIYNSTYYIYSIYAYIFFSPKLYCELLEDIPVSFTFVSIVIRSGIIK